MPQQAWSDKRERQDEHTKDGLLGRGEDAGTAQEFAARTTKKDHARAVEAGPRQEPHRGHLAGAAQQAAIARGAGRPYVPPVATCAHEHIGPP